MLDAEDLVWVRNQIGDKVPPTDGALHDRYDVLGGRVAVAREVWDRRLANLLSSPASFSVSGEYSQDVRDNIAEARKKLNDLGGSGGAEGSIGFASLHRPGRR